MQVPITRTYGLDVGLWSRGGDEKGGINLYVVPSDKELPHGLNQEGTNKEILPAAGQSLLIRQKAPIP